MACPQITIWHALWHWFKTWTNIHTSVREKHMYIYIYIYIYHAALWSGYVVAAPRTRNNNFKKKITGITAFRLFNVTAVWITQIFSPKQIGEFDWTWFYVQSFIHSNHPLMFWQVDIPPMYLTQTLSLPPNIGIPPLTKLGKKRGGKRSREGKTKSSTPTILWASRPPTTCLKGNVTRSEITLMIFFLKCNMHCECYNCDTEQHVHHISSTIVLFDAFFFWRDALSSLSIRL